jgi:hypothetical protein
MPDLDGRSLNKPRRLLDCLFLAWCVNNGGGRPDMVVSSQDVRAILNHDLSFRGAGVISDVCFAGRSEESGGRAALDHILADWSSGGPITPGRDTAVTGARPAVVLGVGNAPVSTGRGMTRRLAPARRTVNDVA